MRRSLHRLDGAGEEVEQQQQKRWANAHRIAVAQASISSKEIRFCVRGKCCVHFHGRKDVTLPEAITDRATDTQTEKQTNLVRALGGFD